MTMKKIMVFAAAVFAAVAFAQTEPVVKMSGLQKIDMESLLDVPVGSTLLGTGIKRTSLEEDVMQIGVPLESHLNGARGRSVVRCASRIFSWTIGG